MTKVAELISTLRQQDVKLWLDGDKLRYRAVKNTLSSELLAQLKIQKTEIIDFLRSIEAMSRSPMPPLIAVDRQHDLPLSFGQQRLWFVHQFDPHSSANNVPVTIRLTGNLSIPALEQSIHEIGMRHEALRTSFPLVAGNPIQSISADFPISIPLVDLQALSPAERQDEALRICAIESRKPFDLEHDPLVRFMLIKFDDRDRLLICNMHCIVCDGASCDLFHIELVALYTAFAAGEPSPLLPLTIQYADFSVWQRQWLQGEILATQVAYWRQKLAGGLSTIKLPFDRPRPPGSQAYLGNSRGMLFPKRLNQDLINLSQQCGVTFFMMLLAAFEVFLHRYSGQDDILISFASAARGQIETEHLLGFFSNTLFLRTKLEPQLTFRQLLDRVRQDCLEAYNHQDIPFEQLVEEIKIEQNQDRSPLFQTKFTLNMPWSEGRGVQVAELPDLKIAPQTGYVYQGQTKYDLILVVREVEDGLRTVFDYNADLFDVPTIDRMLGHMQNLLEGIVANPDCPIAELPLLSDLERQQLQEWNHTQGNYSVKCLHQLVEEQVERTPDTVAIEFEGKKLTYRELNARSNQLARHLQTLAVGANILVGICVERSLETIVGLLGILKAGGAYVPLDPTDPQARLDQILSDAQISIVLIQADLAPRLAKHHMRLVCLDPGWQDIAGEDDRNLAASSMLGDLAATIYISGTNGKPKGVQIAHAAVANLLNSLQIELGVTAKDTCLGSLDISSALTVPEIYLPLVVGAKLVLVSQKVAADASRLAQSIDRAHATVVQATPSTWQRLLATGWTSSSPLKIICGGKTLSPQLADRLLAGGASVWQLYGSIETTGCAIVHEVTAASDNRASAIAVGKPLSHIQAYILDANLQPLPIGVSGELYIGGACLARGYLNLLELTAKKFIEIGADTSFLAGERLYKTGDLACYLPDGRIEYLDRLDDRVEIDGYAIELGEVESVLNQHPEVRQSVVVLSEFTPEDRQLVAYVVATPDFADRHEIELASFLRLKLPNYMVPIKFINLESRSLDRAGKIDRGCLPALNGSSRDREDLFIAPQNELEIELTKIWQKVLGIESIGIRDNFFALGGHSLIAVRLFAEIERLWGRNLPLATLLQAQTIEELASILLEKVSVTPWSSLVPLQIDGSNPPLFVIHSVGGNILEYYKLSQYLGREQPVYALQSQGLDGKNQPLTCVKDMASHYIREIQNIQVRGPYFLAGYSFGGLIVYEIAQQLSAQGHKVSLLALFDTDCPNLVKARPSISKVIQIHLSNLKQLKISDRIRYLIERIEPRIAISYSYKEYIIRELSKTQPLTPEYLELLDCNLDANQSYKAVAYPGKMILFRCQIQDVKAAVYPDLGWNSLINGGLEIKHIPGNHYGMLKEPSVKVLAKTLQNCLQQAKTTNNPQSNS